MFCGIVIYINNVAVICNPRVLKDFIRFDSFWDVNLDHLVKKVPAVGGHVIKFFESAFLNLGDEIWKCACWKWEAMGLLFLTQNLIERNPKGPNVTLLSIFFQSYLRSKVVWSSRSLQFTVITSSYQWESKINQLDLAIFPKHDIFWLDISMNDVHRMTMNQCLTDLLHVFCCLELRYVFHFVFEGAVLA